MATINVTLVHDYSSSWLTSLVEIIVRAYPWWNVAPQLPSYDNRWVCTTQTQNLYVSGYIGDMHYYQLPESIRIRNDLRTVAYRKVTNDNLWAKLLKDSNETMTTAATTQNTKKKTKATSTIKNTKKEWIMDCHIYSRRYFHSKHSLCTKNH